MQTVTGLDDACLGSGGCHLTEMETEVEMEMESSGGQIVRVIVSESESESESTGPVGLPSGPSSQCLRRGRPDLTLPYLTYLTYLTLPTLPYLSLRDLER